MILSSFKNKKILCVFAHPDDETFGPGGTIAVWSGLGATIHLLCATKGEAGINGQNGIRAKELKQASKILGIKKIEFLGFFDGKLCNNDLQDLEKSIIKKIQTFRPNIMLTFNLNGVSGHIDHISVASATTQAFKKTKIAKKLYYYTLPKEHAADNEDYFIHFPQGPKVHEMHEHVDITKVWDIKVGAMQKHKSQAHDIKRILKNWQKYPKKEYFTVLSNNPSNNSLTTP